LPTPGPPPLRSSGRCRAAAARVGLLCATVVVGARRPMPSWPTAVCPCGLSGSASPHGCLRGGPGVRSSLALSSLPGLCPTAPWRLTPAPPPRPLLTARPPPSRGGAGPAMLIPALLRWACGGSSGLLCLCGLSCCPFRLWLFSGAVPRGCSPYSYCRCLPLGSRPGLGLSFCAHARVLCASVSLRVDLCVRVRPCVCLPVITVLLPTGRLCFGACATGARPSPSSWSARLLACFCLR
jgi:hypothetical protein